MKTFTFKYDPTVSLKKMREDMLRAARTGIPHVEHNISKSASIKSMLAVATEGRLSMFQAITKHKPKSLYELAQILEKNQSYVLKEARTLEALKLIELKKEVIDGRECLRPIALYDQIVLDFSFAQEKVS